MSPAEVQLLPFLKPKKSGSIAKVVQTVSGESKREGMEDEMHPDLMKSAESLISGIHAKDASAVADSLKQLHEHLNPKVGEQDENWNTKGIRSFSEDVQ